jgi:membrane-associated phospholipid phosphatase
MRAVTAVLVLPLLLAVVPAVRADEAERTSRFLSNLRPIQIAAPLPGDLLPSLDSPAMQQTVSAPPPVPPHTGLRAVVEQTAADFKSLPQRKSTWIMLGIGGALAAATHPADVDVNRRLQGSTNADRFFKLGKVLGSAEMQAGTAVGLYVYGRYFLPPIEGESRNNKVSHLGFDILRALIVTQAMTFGIKQSVRRDRPTGECCSFPSGHAANAFATASVLERHLGYRAAWPTLAIATYVASSRLNTNRHFLSDVLFGAGVGTAAGWTVVGRHGRSSYAFVPSPVPGGMSFNIVHQPPAP